MDILWKATAFIVSLVFLKVFFTFSLTLFLLYAILCVVQYTFFNRYNWNRRDIFFIETQFCKMQKSSCFLGTQWIVILRIKVCNGQINLLYGCLTSVYMNVEYIKTWTYNIFNICSINRNP